MTTTIDRAEINRRNAQKSTGPKTAEGKARSRFNAVKHGCRARLPILPGEDPEAYQDRLDAWIGKFAPRDAVELYLVERAVHVSWQLDRADRAEVARLADAIDRRGRPAGRGGRRAGGRAVPRPRGPDSVRSRRGRRSPTDRCSPGRSTRSIAGTPPAWSPRWRPPRRAATGCWSEWAELGKILDAGADTGSRPTGCGRSGCWASSRWTWSPTSRCWRSTWPATRWTRRARTCSPSRSSDLRRPEMAGLPRSGWRRRFAAARAERAPRDAAAGRAALRAIVAAAVARVEALREVRAAAEAAGAADITARLSYYGRETVEWLRKHQVTCSRALFRTFDELRKVRRGFRRRPAGGRRAEELRLPARLPTKPTRLRLPSPAGWSNRKCPGRRARSRSSGSRITTPRRTKPATRVPLTGRPPTDTGLLSPPPKP